MSLKLVFAVLLPASLAISQTPYDGKGFAATFQSHAWGTVPYQDAKYSTDNTYLIELGLAPDGRMWRLSPNMYLKETGDFPGPYQMREIWSAKDDVHTILAVGTDTKQTNYDDGGRPNAGRSAATHCALKGEKLDGREMVAGVWGVVTTHRLVDRYDFHEVWWEEANCFPLRKLVTGPYITNDEQVVSFIWGKVDPAKTEIPKNLKEGSQMVAISELLSTYPSTKIRSLTGCKEPVDTYDEFKSPKAKGSK